jgi:hypothetical protein
MTKVLEKPFNTLYLGRSWVLGNGPIFKGKFVAQWLLLVFEPFPRYHSQKYSKINRNTYNLIRQYLEKGYNISNIVKCMGN